MTIFVATGKASEVFFSRPAVVADVVGFEGMAALHVAIHFLRKESEEQRVQGNIFFARCFWLVEGEKDVQMFLLFNGGFGMR